MAPVSVMNVEGAMVVEVSMIVEGAVFAVG
jgi:hypothetical protein